MNLDSIKMFLDNMDGLPTLPDPSGFVDRLESIARILVILGPVVMIILGLLYIFAAPKEANHHFGYRCYFGMGSEKAWQYTQRIAGVTWTVMGAVMTVAMLVATRRFSELGTLDMLTHAALCVGAQALMLVIATVVIRSAVAARFDRHGEPRRRK